MLSFHAFDMGFHAIEAFLPGRNVLVYPQFGRPKSLGFDPAGSNPADLLGAYEPTLLEDTDVFEQRRQGHFEWLREFAYGFGPVAQATDDRPPSRICECGKRSTQVCLILSHVGKYWPRRDLSQGKLSQLANCSGNTGTAAIFPIVLCLPRIKPRRNYGSPHLRFCRADLETLGNSSPVPEFQSPNRKGEHPKERLADFADVLHADAYAGYMKLYSNSIIEAACWAHLRRKFHDVLKIKPSTLADQALQRIGGLYEIEARIKGMPPDERQRQRQEHARPRVDAIHRWIKDTLPKVPQKQTLAEAMRYGLARWDALQVYLNDGTVEIDNNAAERATRPIAVGRNNWLFAGSDAGGERTANILTLIETAKLNGLEPERYLANAIAKIGSSHSADMIKSLPWNWDQDHSPQFA